MDAPFTQAQTRLAMGDHDDRRPIGRAAQFGEDRLFSFHIDRIGGLVQKQQRRPPEERSGQSDALTLDRTELEDAIWVDRAGVKAALAGDPQAPFLAPPPFAIANTLLHRWIETKESER